MKHSWDDIDWVVKGDEKCKLCSDEVEPSLSPELEGLCMECQWDTFETMQEEAVEDYLDDIGMTAEEFDDGYGFDEGYNCE